MRRGEQANATGQALEAARLLTQAQAIDAQHPLVLNLAGVLQLSAGEVAAAKTLFEQAIAADDSNPAFWLNLSSCFRALGLTNDEMTALQRVLKLEPRYLLGLLQKASLLELQGKRREAATIYSDALATIPPGARVPVSLQTALQRAMTAVRANSVGARAVPGSRDCVPNANNCVTPISSVSIIACNL